MRNTLSSRIKISRNKVMHHAAVMGNKERIERHISAQQIMERNNKEIRIKTTRAQKMRKKIIIATQSSRAKIMIERISSANQIRSESRLRFASSQS